MIRFDKGDFLFNESDFELKPPSEWAAVSYKPITSKILYKNGPCTIRFPLQYGYGLNEIKSEKRNIEDKGFSYTYLKKDETEEEKRFVKFINAFEDWYKKSVTRIAKEQFLAQSNKQPSVFSRKLAKELSEDSNIIKPFFCFPKNQETKEFDKTKSLRHYIKFRSSGSNGEPNCSVYNLDNAKNLSPLDIVSTEIEKKTGHYIVVVKIKGIFFKSSEDYSAIPQTVGEVVCYRKTAGYDPLDVMGKDYNSNQDEDEDGDDTTFEMNMLKKVLSE